MAKRNNQYTIINESDFRPSNPEELLIGGRGLTGSGFRLYVYCCSQLKDSPYNFSPALFCEITGLSENSAHNAVKELITKEYFKQEEDVLYFRAPQILVQFGSS